jgi:hypothetical protein
VIPRTGGENHESDVISGGADAARRLAQPINIDNNPNQPGYVVPSQQRMQNEMKVQQQQQQSMLKQNLNNQTRSQQQHLQNQLQTNQQRAAQGGNINPPQQVLPNNNGGMLRQTNP